MNRVRCLLKAPVAIFLFGIFFNSHANAIVQLNVDSTGASGVTITSTTGHSGVTDYIIYGIPDHTVTSLQAPLASGGMNFLSWLGCNSTSGTGGSTCGVTLDYNWTVIAEYGFELIVRSAGAPGVIITSSTGHGGTTDYSRQLASDTTVNLQAPIDFDYKAFAGWFGCDSVEGATCSVTMNAHKTVTASYAKPWEPCVTTWKTDNTGTSNDTSITVPMVGGPYSVDWNNDGVPDQTVTSGPVTHDFKDPGEYVIRIYGSFDAIQFNNGGDKDKILSVDQWGRSSQWKTMAGAFYGATNLQISATDTPDFSAVTDMSFMFARAALANPYTYHWNTRNVTNMRDMFANAKAANPYTVLWATSSVTDMRNMFYNATSFDRDISSWDVHSLTQAAGMLSGVTLSRSNYESLLMGWDAQLLKSGVSFDGGNSTYCSTESVAARSNMTVSDGWTITDGGESCSEISIVPWEQYPRTDEYDYGHQIEVYLGGAPDSDVSIAFSSDDTTEGTVSPSSLTFTPMNWATPQRVEVRGVDDPADDGDVYYNIIIAPATSEDVTYHGLDPDDILVQNIDDDVFGVDIWPLSLTTTENGGTATIEIVLQAAPMDELIIEFVSDDLTEGEVDWPTVVFDGYSVWGELSNWNIPQFVTVRGVDDAVDDGDTGYVISATSWGAEYTIGIDVEATNIDDDTSGITVSAISDNTTEAGGTGTFTMVLDSKPLGDVTIGLTSDDISEGTASPSSVTFTSENWDVEQLLTVTGVGDAEDDGDIVYNIISAAATSTDSKYNGLNPSDVSVTNIGDNYYSIGGNVSGLAGTGLVLQNNGGYNHSIVEDGSFMFATALADESTYAVTIKTQPTSPVQVCSVSNGSGTLAGADITDVVITCVTKPENIFINGFEE